MFASVLFWLFILAVVMQCLYALGIFSKVFSLSKPVLPTNTEKRPVSILICARDEAGNLRRNLPQIMAQRYSNEAGKAQYEVIVVNDCSTDNTEGVLQDLERQYDNLWHVTISPDEDRMFPGKKFALSEGLKHVGNELLLLTDADCTPASENWLAYMAEPLNEGREIVAGYGKYRTSGGALNAFNRWETLHSFLQYSSYARVSMPYMAVGRNLACTKDIFLKAQATEVWSALPSGDDDLLVSTMATGDNIAIICHEDAFTLTDSKPTWGEWMKQKQRHLSTGKYYRSDVKSLLGGYAFSHALMWLTFFVLLWFKPEMALIIMGGRCAIYWLIWAVTAGRLREVSLILFFPLFDIGWMIYNFAFSPYIFLKNKTQWK